MIEQDTHDIHGFVAPGYEIVRDTFTANFVRRREVGAAFAAYRGDECIVDLWGGIANTTTGARWQIDTLQIIFSGTKGITAAVMLLLLDRGELDLESPVAEYWPEFAAAGKDKITVGDVLSHQCGLAWIEQNLSGPDLLDTRNLARLLADQPAVYPPNKRAAYHALTYGWLCSEIVFRITGASIGSLVASDLAAALDAEIYLGLPERWEDRVSELCTGDGFASLTRRLGWGAGGRRYINPPILEEPYLLNLPQFHAVEIPGVNAVVEARGMARLYSCLANTGSFRGTQLVRPSSIATAVRPRCNTFDAWDPDFPIVFGAGFELQNGPGVYGPPGDAFGHGGAGGSIHGAWPSHGVGFSYTMNQLRDDAVDDRGRALIASLYCAVGLL
jgi:CubicO group peptidase (beta-lactamase class C family)